jgi:two-component system, cell cycle response regulator
MNREMVSRLGRVIPAVLGIAVLAAIWAHALLAFGDAGTADFFARWMHDAVFVLAGLACLADALTARRRRLPAAALGAGLLLVTVGDLIYSMAPNLDEVPVPSLSDPFWLAMYPCVYLALLVLTRERVGRTLAATRLDGIVSGFAAASLLASLTMSTAIDSTAGAPFAEQLTNLAYPTADLVLLGAIVSAIALAGWRIDRLWMLFGGAIAAFEAANLIYMLGSDGQIGIVADALVATGAMGLATAMVTRPRTAARHAGHNARGLFVPVAFGSVALGLLAVSVPLRVNGVAIGLAVTTLALVLARMLLALKENQALLGASRVEATTDSLTGLSNRRKLKADLAHALADGAPHALVLLDLNGFKSYNDSYGHGAGDALLAQLGGALAAGVRGVGDAYRMGGDEFCVLARAPADIDALGALCAEALATRGNGFSITAAYGAVLLPEEAHDANTALVLADTRMYRQKNSSRLPAAHQSAGVLIAVLEERAPRLASHVHTVTELACATAAGLGMEGDDLDALRHAAALHGGYPDGLSGNAIPIGSRVILVAAAFDAMTSERRYGRTLSTDEALGELRRCAGTQFDASVVAAFERVVTAQAASVGGYLRGASSPALTLGLRSPSRLA